MAGAKLHQLPHAHALLALFILWLAAAPISCLFGPYPLGISQIWAVLCHMAHLPVGSEQSQSAWLIVSHLRLARSGIALLCGGALACAGVTLQGLLRNPLADPFTLGISAGAACGASLAITFLSTTTIHFSQSLFITMAALTGALTALFTSLFLGKAGSSHAKENIILSGMAVAAFLGSIVALIKALNEDSVTSIVFWIMGSLQGRSWSSYPILLATFIPGILLILAGWRKLDVFALGDEQAATLGLRPERSRFWLLCGACCMTAGCVAICGIIGFVGLVVPHIIRLLIGPAHAPLLLASFFGGGLFLLVADCLARSVLDGGQELPVGVITALVGGPFFAFLVWKRQ